MGSTSSGNSLKVNPVGNAIVDTRLAVRPKDDKSIAMHHPLITFMALLVPDPIAVLAALTALAAAFAAEFKVFTFDCIEF
jgi:hypothetical protein